MSHRNLSALRCLRRASVFMALALLAGCQQDNEEANKNIEEDNRGATLNVATLMSRGQENYSRSPFIVDGMEYTPFNEMYPEILNNENAAVGVFLVPADKADISVTQTSGFFQYSSSGKWTSNVLVKEQDYFLYGFMPRLNSLTSTILTRRKDPTDNTKYLGWGEGAVITLTNFPTVTDADACVITGVLKAVMDEASGVIPSIDDTDIVSQLQRGVYGYQGLLKDNYVYLLLDHLYTNVNFELRVEEKYAAMRTIVLTDVTMKSAVSPTITLNVEVTNDAAKPIESIKYQNESGGTTALVHLLPNGARKQVAMTATDGSLYVLKEEPLIDKADNRVAAGPTSVPGYFAPAKEKQEFECTFTYDVLDKEGNVVRKDAKAVNKWVLPDGSVTAGRSYKVSVMIRPTYLYQLSEPDLDNPTFTLQ